VFTARYGLDPYVTIRFVSKELNCDFVITSLYFGLVLLLKIVSSFFYLLYPLPLECHMNGRNMWQVIVFKNYLNSVHLVCITIILYMCVYIYIHIYIYIYIYITRSLVQLRINLSYHRREPLSTKSTRHYNPFWNAIQDPKFWSPINIFRLALLVRVSHFLTCFIAGTA
jgi:hypothetical protein